jgi:2-polyprenyl-6-methoxyphenol hydroxylase-like FAD-dependent oxidoreductase
MMAQQRGQGRAVVIGAGIGGLTAAVALHRRGWRVTVLERATSLEPVGAGIALAPNALKALDSVGLGSDVRAMAAIQGSGGVRRPDGTWLVRTELTAIEDRFGWPIIIAARPELIELLAAQLPADSVRTATPVLGVTPGGAGGTDGSGDSDDSADSANAADSDAARGPEQGSAIVRTGSGDLAAQIVVAADGIRSQTRATLFPEHPGPRYAGFTTWRFIAPAPLEPFDPSETWGRGEIFGAVPMTGGRLYCYATANLPSGVTHPDEHAELLRRFGAWHGPIPEILESVPAEAVLRNDAQWLAEPLTAYHRGRIALLGDAAHAMTPNLGQGGCQAIEDAVVLAHHLRDPEAAVGPALAAYTADRLPRASRIARQSARTGRFQQWSAAPAVAFRDSAVRLTGRLGSGVLIRQMAQLADWTPPGR